MFLSPLPSQWYEQDVLSVARGLLGKKLVRQVNDQRISGCIVETEAYRGEEDLACHARAGRTRRTEVMYGQPGRAYIYFTYGMHWCLNAVCMPAGFPAAVLLRAITPLEGLPFIAAQRSGRPQPEWTNGPAKLTQALAITGNLNGCDLTDPASGLWIEDAPPVMETAVHSSARVGLGTTPEPWLSQPWRFWITFAEDGKKAAV